MMIARSAAALVAGRAAAASGLALHGAAARAFAAPTGTETGTEGSTGRNPAEKAANEAAPDADVPPQNPSVNSIRHMMGKLNQAVGGDYDFPQTGGARVRDMASEIAGNATQPLEAAADSAGDGVMGAADAVAGAGQKARMGLFCLRGALRGCGWVTDAAKSAAARARSAAGGAAAAAHDAGARAAEGGGAATHKLAEHMRGEDRGEGGGEGGAGRTAAEWEGLRAVLYTHTCCPYAQRVLMAMLHKGIPFDLVQVDLSRKPGWYRAVNPRGLVPAVAWRGGAVAESVDIVRWLDTEFEGAASLTPKDASLRRTMGSLVDRAAPDIVAAGLDAVGGATSHAWGIGSGAAPSQLSRLEAALAPLTGALASGGGPFLAGPELSAADAVIYPFLERFDLALRLFHGYDLAAFD
ncbi:MAG: hypothetical protein J3K34DRAFT_455842, partial [Monoraphidium minutum]